MEAPILMFRFSLVCSRREERTFATLNWEGASPDPWDKQRPLRAEPIILCTIQEPIILCAKLSLVSTYQTPKGTRTHGKNVY